MISILLVDDHHLFRAAVKCLLAQAADCSVIAEAATGEEALQLTRQHSPQVVIMDVRMPGIGGLEATKKLVRAHPDSHVLVLSACADEPFPSRLLQAGALGYITKDCSFDDLMQAIRAVARGQRYLTPAIAQQIALKHVSDEGQSPLDVLSEREMQVMLMITRGQKVQEISEQLCLSPKTINSYRYRIFEKLAVHSDVELTHIAYQHGLLDTHG